MRKMTIQRALSVLVITATLMQTMPLHSLAFGLFGTQTKDPGSTVSEQGSQKMYFTSAIATAGGNYAFQFGETIIYPGMEAAAVIAVLGNPTKPVFEVDSCAYQGKDKVYTYKGFEVSTGQKDGKDYITSVYVTGKDIATQEGIQIGSKVQEVTKAYGETKDEYGVYRYRKGNAELCIYTTNGVVDSFEYLICTE